MQDISISSFQHDNFGNIRVISDDNGNPWFVAKDIADILGYSETARMTSRLDDDEKMSTKIVGISKTNPVVTLINESGFYNAVIGSHKPEAKAFRKWVTSEVLPSIRKHGVYRLSSRGLSENDFIEHNSYFWLDIETLSKHLRESDSDSTVERLEASIFYAKEYVEKEYVAIIRGQKYLRDEGIYFISMLSADKKALPFCNTVREVLGNLKVQTIKSEKIKAVRAYQEVVSRITASGHDVSFIRSLIRYKRKELTSREIAVLTGQMEDEVAVYLEELETSGIMDMADLLEGSSPALCLPQVPVKEIKNQDASLFTVSNELVKSLGFNEAMILHQLDTMIMQEKRGYVHITYKEWIKRFPFKSEETLMRLVRKLENMGIIESKRVFINFQRIKEYRINREVLKQYSIKEVAALIS